MRGKQRKADIGLSKVYIGSEKADIQNMFKQTKTGTSVFVFL